MKKKLSPEAQAILDKHNAEMAWGTAMAIRVVPVIFGAHRR